MRKLIIIACCMLMGCDRFREGSVVVQIANTSGACTYTTRYHYINGTGFTETLVKAPCGKFQIGDTLYLTKTK